MIDALGFSGRLDRNVGAEPLWRFVDLGLMTRLHGPKTGRWSIGPHQHTVANLQVGMDDPRVAFESRRAGWHVAIAHQCRYPATEHLLIQFERLLALAIEEKVSIQIHAGLHPALNARYHAWFNRRAM